MGATTDIILSILITICSIFVIIINVSLLISVLKTQKNTSIIKTLSIQLLLSTTLYSFSFTLTYVQKLGVSINCYVFNIENSFSGTSMVLSLLSITLNSYFILTNNYTFHRKKQLVLVLLVLLTWIPSIGFLILFFAFRNTKMKYCRIEDGSYWKWKTNPEKFIEIFTIVICIILLFKVCTLKVQNDKELQISKKKTISKIVSYIIMIIVGIALKTLAFIVFRPISETLQSYIIIVLCVYLLILNYVFLWSKQMKESLVSTYCCRESEKTDETMMKNNQKELAFQYNLAEDQQNFDGEEDI